MEIRDYETRLVEKAQLEVRATGEGESRELGGYAAVFNSLSQQLYSKEKQVAFRERIAPGAFADALKSDADIFAFVDHNTASTHTLGRTSTGTLRLEEDEQGLRVSITPPDTSIARDLLSLIPDYVNAMSFGFQVPKNGDSWKQEGNEWVRTINRANLAEVSVVTLPAYLDTSISKRVSPATYEALENYIASTHTSKTPLDVLAKLLEIKRKQLAMLN